jgi:hypothetical protein
LPHPDPLQPRAALAAAQAEGVKNDSKN